MFKWPLFIIILLSIFSCGKTTDEQLADTILSANIQLSQGDCQAAINLLESYGRVNDNVHYIKTLASAYACRGGYSTVTFFGSDITKTISPIPLGGTSIYTTSLRNFQSPLEDDPYYRDLLEAINILLYAGGIAATTEPNVAERAKYFSAGDAGDLNAELLYLELVQIGILFHVYGNGDINGVKGKGSLSNHCLTSYDKVQITPISGVCTSQTSGNSQIDKSITDDTIRKRRLCHGVVAMNGIIELLPNLITTIIPNKTDQDNLKTQVQAITSLITGVSALGIVSSTQNQLKCENLSNVSIIQIEGYYVGVMESVFK